MHELDALFLLENLLKINPKYVFNYIKTNEYNHYDWFYSFNLLSLLFSHLKENGFHSDFNEQNYQEIYEFVIDKANSNDDLQMKKFILFMLGNMTVGDIGK